MPNDTRATLLREISNFSTEEVVDLLQKNKLSECCDAVIKREVDGEALLQLSERNLNLWKSDLTESLRRSLCDFVAELNNDPEHYVPEYDELTSPSPSNSDALDDYWDTEFEDEEATESTDEDFSYNGHSDDNLEMYGNSNSRGQVRDGLPGIPDNRALPVEEENDENENCYANGTELNNSSRSPNPTTRSNGLSLDEELRIALEQRKNGPKPLLSQKTAEVLQVVRNTQILLHSQMPSTQRNNSNAMPPRLEGKQTDEVHSMQQPMGIRSCQSKQNIRKQMTPRLNNMASHEVSQDIGIQRMKHPHARPSPETKPNIEAPKMQQLDTRPSLESKPNIRVKRMEHPNTRPNPESVPNIGTQKMQQPDTRPSLESKPNIRVKKMEHPNTRPNPESETNIGAQKMQQPDTRPGFKSTSNIEAKRIEHPNTRPGPESKRIMQLPSKQPPERNRLPPKPKSTLTKPPLLPLLKPPSVTLPKPPSITLSFENLNLPSDHSLKQNEDSDGDYEPIKEQSTRPHHRSSESVTSNHSTQHLGSVRSIRGSNESIDHPSSRNSFEEQPVVYEEIPQKKVPEEENEQYVPPIQYPLHSSLPRFTRPRSPDSSSLPIGRQLLGGLGSRLADEVADMIVRIKRGLLRCCHAQPSESPDPLEPPKPPERPTRTFPLTGRQTGRPLPPTPNTPRIERPVENWESEVPSYTKQLWYHDVDRKEAEDLIEGGSSKFPNGPPDGYFLLRPSTTNENQPFTLVLWYKNRTWNLPVRKRHDNKFALGTVRADEVSFKTVEELVNFHKKNVILLKNANADAVASSTQLTDSPRK